MTLEELRTFQRTNFAPESGPFFLGLPERWMDDPTWRCVNGHVSKRFLKTETRGDCCLACREPLVMTFPEDHE